MQNSLVARKEGDFYSEFVSYSRNENIRGIELPRKIAKKEGDFHTEFAFNSCKDIRALK